MSNEQYLADRIALQDVMLKYAAGVDAVSYTHLTLPTTD